MTAKAGWAGIEGVAWTGRKKDQAFTPDPLGLRLIDRPLRILALLP